MIICGGAMGLLMCCVVEQHEGGVNPTESMTRALISDDSIARQSTLGPVQLGFVAGVILRERIPPFERMLWRACRGNVFLRQAEIETPLEDPSTGDNVYKSVFIIFFQGDQLKTRVKKICEGFRATLYPCPEAPGDRREMAMGVMTRIEDLNTLALRRGTERSGSSVPPILNRMETLEDPPTYNHTNKFTSAFQTLIDSYGIASYREMNPAPYTIITFPFLFAVMFGDLGHGLLMATFGAWMVLKEKPLAAKKSDNEIWNIFFGGRYIVLLMGLFSMYTGFIYNDVFSKSLNIFGSNWEIKNLTKSYVVTIQDHMLDPAEGDYIDYPYPIGMDPVWQLAKNKIIFQNSFKMKISIILGIIHMLFGVSMSLFNYLYFNNKLSIFCEFIPQVIFLVFLFFYMVLLMFIKWFMYFPTNVFDKQCDATMFAGQISIQKLLFACAVICVPWMLLAKPIYIMRSQRKMNYSVSHQQMQAATGNGDAEQPIHNNTAQPISGHGGEHTEEDLGEMFIHQGIHTIEYVLGSVSHTASYLRLWALSLAHAQLSEVLWNMVLSKGLMLPDWGGGVALGSAIAKIVGNNALRLPNFDDRVTMYVYEEIINGKKLTDIINETHENVKYLPGYKLPPNVVAIPDVVEAAKDADILIFVLPHQFIRTLCSTLLGKIKPTAIALSLIK
ncbi:V ATPase I and/or NAD Gly3P dh N domain containing protein, partial [Asbolus verrucosus]